MAEFSPEYDALMQFAADANEAIGLLRIAIHRWSRPSRSTILEALARLWMAVTGRDA